MVSGKPGLSCYGQTKGERRERAGKTPGTSKSEGEYQAVVSSGASAESQGLRLEGRSVERSTWQHEELGFLHEACKETPSVSSEVGPDLSSVSGTGFRDVTG